MKKKMFLILSLILISIKIYAPITVDATISNKYESLSYSKYDDHIEITK